MLKILKKFFYSTVSVRLLSIGLNFLGSILVNRTLGLELRGEYTTVYTYANLLQSIVNLGIIYAYVPFREKVGEEKAREVIYSLIWIQLIFCLLGSGVFLLISFSLTNLFICALMSAMVINCQIVFLALIQDIDYRNKVLLLCSAVYLLANVVIYLFFDKALYLILCCLIGKYLIEAFFCMKGGSIGPLHLQCLSWGDVLYVMRNGLPTAVLAILITLNYNVDVILLNGLNAGDYEVGLFGVAYTLSNMLWFIPDAFKEYVFNRSARANISGLVLILVGANMLICAFICLIFAVFGKMLLALLYGVEFSAAYQVTLVVFLGIIPMVAFKLIHPLYVNSGRSLTVVVLLGVSVLANGIAAFLLIPAQGALGAAIATVLAYSLCGLLFCTRYVKDYQIKANDIKNSLKAIRESL